MSRPYYVDKIIGGDGVLRYSLKDNTGKVLYDNITLEMTSPVRQQGTGIGSKDFIRLTSMSNLGMFPGIKIVTNTNFDGLGNILAEVRDVEDGRNELIAKETTKFNQGADKTEIVTDYVYYQNNNVLYHLETTTKFPLGSIEESTRFLA